MKRMSEAKSRFNIDHRDLAAVIAVFCDLQTGETFQSSFFSLTKMSEDTFRVKVDEDELAEELVEG